MNNQYIIYNNSTKKNKLSINYVFLKSHTTMREASTTTATATATKSSDAEKMTKKHMSSVGSKENHQLAFEEEIRKTNSLYNS